MKISIIVSIYNSANYLHRSLDSIVNQTYPNLEIILVNAGSTDNSEEIIQTYAKNDDRIVAITTEHCGIGKAFKIALKKVTGSYITFVDSDDYLELFAYEELIAIAKRENPDFIHFGITTRNPHGEVIKLHEALDEIAYDNRKIMYNHFDKLKHPILVRLFKANLFNDVIIFDQNIGIDEMLTPQLMAKSNKAVYTSKSYYNVIAREDSVCRKDYTELTIKQTITIFRFVCSFMEKTNPKFASYSFLKYVKFLNSIYNKVHLKELSLSDETMLDIKQDIKKYFPFIKQSSIYKKENRKIKISLLLLTRYPYIYNIQHTIRNLYLLSFNIF